MVLIRDIEQRSDTKVQYGEISQFFKVYVKNFPLMIESFCDCAVKAAFDLNTDAIFLISNNEISCKILSKYRPNCPIYSVVFDLFSFNILRLIRGVFPILIENVNKELEDVEIRWFILF